MLQRSIRQVLVAFCLDWLSVLVAAGLSSWLRLVIPFGYPLKQLPGMVNLFASVLIIYPLIFLLFALYDPERKLPAATEFTSLLFASVVAGLVVAGVIYFTARDISRLHLIYFYVVHLMLVFGWRFVSWTFPNNHTGNRQHTRRVLLIGGGEGAHRVLQQMEQLSWAGVQLVGYITDGEKIPMASSLIPHLGSTQQAAHILKEIQVEDVLIALPAEAYDRVQELTTALIDLPLNIWVVPDYFRLLLYRAQVDDLGGIPMINLRAPALSGYQRLTKRAFDLLVSTIVILLALPWMAMIAAAIRLDSPGPVLFRQRRVGENGRMFEILKFRSMVAGAEEQLEHPRMGTGDGNRVHKSPDDPRVTRVGRFLRRTSLDELPQFINVLKGEMSLVGPRPELPMLVAEYQPWQRKRLAVPPGITGWWQVTGRSEKPLHLHTEDDLYYIQNYSLLFDIQILFRTIFAVLRARGAY